MQDTYDAALRSARSGVSVEDPTAWLYGIARNRALDALRRRRRLGAALERMTTVIHKSHDVEEGPAVTAIRDVLERALDPEDRALVLLRYVHDFTAPELAELLHASPDAIRQRLSRACARLARAARQELRDETSD